MNFFSILAAVGLLAFAGLCGVILAKIEEKIKGGKNRNLRL